jgi:Cu/Ag efflux pump CusA
LALDQARTDFDIVVASHRGFRQIGSLINSPPLSGGTGQFEFLERTTERLKLVVMATLLIIFMLLYPTLGSLAEAGLIMAKLPFAITGGFWLLHLLGYNQSVATGVGFIALAGVSADFGVVMPSHLKPALPASAARRRLERTRFRKPSR